MEGFAIAVFASFSAVNRFFEVNQHMEDMPCVAIGPVTEAELQRKNIRRIFTTKKTDTNAIVDCLLHISSEGEKK